MICDEDIRPFGIEQLFTANPNPHAAQPQPAATAKQCPGIKPFAAAGKRRHKNSRRSHDQNQDAGHK